MAVQTWLTVNTKQSKFQQTKMAAKHFKYNQSQDSKEKSGPITEQH